MRPLALIAAVVIAAGCGAADANDDVRVSDSGRIERRAAAQPPEGARPRFGSSEQAPPPAWVETARGSFWLGYSSFCWDGTCADFVAPDCGDAPHVPEIEVRSGELIRFHLGFTPRTVSVATFGGETAQDPLPPERDPVWRAREGAFAVFAVPKERGGDASYVGCMVTR